MINQELFDRQVEHLISTRRYSAAVELLIRKASRRHQITLKGLLKGQLRDEIPTEVGRYVNELYDLSANSVGDFIGAELDFQTNSLQKATDKWYKVARPLRPELERAILSQPLRIKGTSTVAPEMNEAFKRLGTSELTAINAKIRRGIVKGWSEDQLVEEVLKSSKLTENQAKTLVITNLTQAETTVKTKVLEANSAVIKGVVFTAILDSRTSTTCRHYDDLFQTVDNIRVRPPLHWRCRSTLIPVLKAASELERLNSPLVDHTLLDPTKLTGELPRKETLDQWLQRQAFSTQVDYLGSEEKVTLFQQGALAVSDFFDTLGRPISLAALRVKDNLLTFTGIGVAREKTLLQLRSSVNRPFQLVRSSSLQRDLRDFYVAEAANANSSLSLVDYKGTSIAGKRGVRQRTTNTMDERNNSFDPFTGEAKSTLYYDPNWSLYRERVDYMRDSKLLDKNQKDFIEQFAESFDERLSINQRTAVVENLRVVFERYEKNKQPWEDFGAVLNSEMPYSVVNTSRILDRRSRESSELFLSWKGDPTEPSVFIQGQRITLEELHRDKILYENFVRNWRTDYGSTFARKFFYTGKAPLRAYYYRLVSGLPKPVKTLKDKLIDSFEKQTLRKLFFRDDPVGFFLAYGKAPKAALKIVKEHIVDEVKGSIPFYKFLKKLNEEGFLNFIDRTIRENYRYIVDLQFVRENLRLNAVEAVNKGLLKEDQVFIRALAKSVETIAEGTMTDYDGLAIAVGRNMKESFPDFYWFLGTSLDDYHAEGSKLLAALEEAKLIRVNSRGVVRRAVVDLDTGRPSGAWKDTVSREVEILDPEMLQLQDYNRRIELSNRLGVTSPTNKYYVVAGKKTYLDARGVDTGVPVVTRSAFANFSEKQLDKDFADMLNHTMASEYEVDPEFSSFMDDLVRFRDNRGNADFYDNLNGFREEIIRRGDQGYGLMEVLRYYRKTGKPFTVHARIDGRGRVYYNGYLTPTGGEVVRPFINSAHATAMTPAGLEQIKIQMASVIGPGTEALTTAGRLAIFDRHEADILRVGRLMTETTQRDRRLREFLEDPFMQTIEPEEIAKIARFSLEYYRIYQHTGGKITPERLATYYTKLMGEADASASGLQVIALSTGNRGAALTSNVLLTRSKQRIYDLVAQDVVSDPRFHQLMEELGLDLTWEDLSKAAKYQVMIAFYGAGRAGQTARVALEMAKVLRKQDILVTTRAEFLTISKLIDQKIKEAQAINAIDVEVDLKNLKKELLELVNNPESSIGVDILQQAEEIHPDVADVVRKYTGVRGNRVGPEHFKQIAALMSEKLAERAPVTSTYIDFWKRIAQDYARTTKKVDIPWVTFDNKTLMQRYRPKVQKEIRFYDPESGRYIRNIYQTELDSGRLLGKGSIGDVRLGFGVNGNHALDASLVRMYHLWGRANGVLTSTIHDAMFMNINELDQGVWAMRDVYARARQFNNIKATLDALRKEGLPEALYQQYLKEAEELGFFDNGFSVEEMLEDQAKKPGYDFYGWGP